MIDGTEMRLGSEEKGTCDERRHWPVDKVPAP